MKPIKLATAAPAAARSGEGDALRAPGAQADPAIAAADDEVLAAALHERLNVDESKARRIRDRHRMIRKEKSERSQVMASLEDSLATTALLIAKAEAEAKVIGDDQVLLLARLFADRFVEGRPPLDLPLFPSVLGVAAPETHAEERIKMRSARGVTTSAKR